MKIDPEFSCLCPLLSDEERAGLAASLRAHGCREPLVIWKEKGILLDGHNRAAICDEEGIKYRTVEYSFHDRDAARNWIIDNALARRNLNDEQRRYLRGKRVLAEAKPVGRPPKSSHTETVSGDTAERIAEREGVSRATIERDASYARAVDKIADSAGPKARTAILSGAIPLTRAQVERVAERAPKTITQVREMATKRTPVKKKADIRGENGCAARCLALAESLTGLLGQWENGIPDGFNDNFDHDELEPLWVLRAAINSLEAALAAKE